jgi:hypothetical protein
MLLFFTACQKETLAIREPIHSIFYQPLLKDKMDWEQNFKKLNEAHIQSIILQWSKFGVVDFIQDEQWLKTILSTAQKENIKVIVGLYGDNNYFKVLEDKNVNLQSYFQELHHKNIEQAQKIYTIAKEYPSFDGYYIYDEIDDTQFIDSQREAYLKFYLQSMADDIALISPHQLYISGYFSKHISASNYANMFSNILQNRYILLLQSGIGAKLVNYEESIKYMEYFNREYKGQFIPIVEAFRYKDDKLEAVDLLSLKKEIELLSKSVNGSKLTLFSLRYFLDKTLFSNYVLEYID